jgi:hypothetical protein
LLTVNYKTAQTVTPEERMAELATVSRTDAPLKVRKLGAFLGAEVTGIDLTRPLDDATVKAVDAALVAHEILVFPAKRSVRRTSNVLAAILGNSLCIRFQRMPPKARN